MAIIAPNTWDGTAKTPALSMLNGINCGLGTLVAGTLVISTAAITATSLVMLTPRADPSLISSVYWLDEDFAVRNPGTDFTVVSSNVADTRDFAWMIVEPF